MPAIRLCCSILLLAVLAPSLVAQSPGSSGPTYLLPPKEVIEAFEATPLPEAILSPSLQVMALTSRKGQPTIAALAQPMLRLAGARVNPKAFGPHRTPLVYAVALVKIADGSQISVTVPPQASLSYLKFSPDGSKLAFLNTKSDGIELWIADLAPAKPRPLTAPTPLNP